MTPVDFRNETFESIQGRLTTARQAVWRAFSQHGPATTRQVAIASRIDILALRPRATELYQMGVLELVSGSAHEGVYRARSYTDWQNWCATEMDRMRVDSQAMLPL